MGIYSGLLAGNYIYTGSNYYTGTQVYQGAGGWEIYTATAATSGGNVNSSPFSIQGNCWNGSAQRVRPEVVATPLPLERTSVTMNVTSTNTGDAMYCTGERPQIPSRSLISNHRGSTTWRGRITGNTRLPEPLRETSLSQTAIAQPRCSLVHHNQRNERQCDDHGHDLQRSL